MQRKFIFFKKGLKLLLILKILEMFINRVILILQSLSSLRSRLFTFGYDLTEEPSLVIGQSGRCCFYYIDLDLQRNVNIVIFVFLRKLKIWFQNFCLCIKMEWIVKLERYMIILNFIPICFSPELTKFHVF